MNDLAQLIEAQGYARGAVARLLRRYPDDVDDVLQQAALKAWRGRERFRGDSTFLSWFTRIAINEALQRLRHVRDSTESRSTSLDAPQGTDGEEEGLTLAGLLASEEPGPEEIAAREERVRLLLEEVRRLSLPLQRAVGKRLADVPLGNGEKANLFRAKRRMREAFERRGVL